MRPLHKVYTLPEGEQCTSAGCSSRTCGPRGGFGHSSARLERDINNCRSVWN